MEHRDVQLNLLLFDVSLFVSRFIAQNQLIDQ